MIQFNYIKLNYELYRIQRIGFDWLEISFEFLLCFI